MPSLFTRAGTVFSDALDSGDIGYSGHSGGRRVRSCGERAGAKPFALAAGRDGRGSTSGANERLGLPGRDGVAASICAIGWFRSRQVLRSCCSHNARCDALCRRCGSDSQAAQDGTRRCSPTERGDLVWPGGGDFGGMGALHAPHGGISLAGVHVCARANPCRQSAAVVAEAGIDGHSRRASDGHCLLPNNDRGRRLVQSGGRSHGLRRYRECAR